MAKSPTMKAVRRAVRKELHRYLDAMLKCPVKAPNGDTVTMLDDLCVRAVLGFGFAVSISCQHPEHPEQTQDLTPTEAPPAARSPVRLHAPTCTDAACPGCAGPVAKLEVVK